LLLGCQRIEARAAFFVNRESAQKLAIVSAIA